MYTSTRCLDEHTSFRSASLNSKIFRYRGCKGTPITTILIMMGQYLFPPPRFQGRDRDWKMNSITTPLITIRHHLHLPPRLRGRIRRDRESKMASTLRVTVPNRALFPTQNVFFAYTQYSKRVKSCNLALFFNRKEDSESCCIDLVD